MIDCHCHLQDEKLKNRLNEIIEKAGGAGVTGVISCGTRESDWAEVLEISKGFPGVIFPSFGLHPWYLKDRSRDWLVNLEKMLTDNPKSGVGEIGLDYAIDGINKDEQIMAFKHQLELARNYERPVSIHCRRAWDDLLKILAEGGVFPKGGLVHSFSGGSELVPQITALGISVSFSCSVVNSGNKKGRKALVCTPKEHLLLETDSPDMLPAGMEGVNEPANLILVVKTAAELVKCPEEEIVRLTAENAERIFGLLR